MTDSPNSGNAGNAGNAPARVLPDSYGSRRRAGRTLGWIARVDTRDKGFIFAMSANGDYEELFLHRSAMKGSLWESLDVGDVISCQVSDPPRGPRGFDVQRVMDEAVVAQVKEMEEQYGNR